MMSKGTYSMLEGLDYVISLAYCEISYSRMVTVAREPHPSLQPFAATNKVRIYYSWKKAQGTHPEHLGVEIRVNGEQLLQLIRCLLPPFFGRQFREEMIASFLAEGSANNAHRQE